MSRACNWPPVVAPPRERRELRAACCRMRSQPTPCGAPRMYDNVQSGCRARKIMGARTESREELHEFRRSRAGADACARRAASPIDEELKCSSTISIGSQISSRVTATPCFRGGGARCRSSRRREVSIPRRSTIISRDSSMSWRASSARGRTRPSPRRSPRAAPRRMACSGSRTHSTSKRSWPSTTSCAAASTTSPMRTA